jgi:hypothetical protein
MQRIDHASAAANLNGPGKAGFTGGDPIALVPPTVVTAAWCNGVQEELASVIETVMPLEGAANNQLLTALAFPMGLLSAGTMRKVIDVAVGLRAAANATRGDRTCWLIDAAGGLRDLQNTVPTLDTSNDLNAIAYLESIDAFAAVGDTGEIQSSIAGAAWAHRTQAASYAGKWWDIIAGPGLFVAVGQDNEIQTSADGLTWVKRVSALPNDSTLVRVRYSPAARRYLILGADPVVGDVIGRSRMQWSADGITWTSTVTPPDFDGASNPLEIGPSPVGFVAVNHAEFSESADGLTWSAAAAHGGDFEPEAISPGGFLIEPTTVDGQHPRVAMSPHQAPFEMATHVTVALVPILRVTGRWVAADSASKIWASEGLPF